MENKCEIENFIENLKSIPNYAEKTPEELFEIVTLASIVEKEYKVKEEAPLIASVFKNRIRHNIGLYSCATIVYIITEIQGNPHPNRILTKDTKIEITIKEGKNRQIRKMFASLGYEVISLKRVQHGTITLEGLKKGQIKPMKPKQVKELKSYLAKIRREKND